jgi:hypothetical protein
VGLLHECVERSGWGAKKPAPAGRRGPLQFFIDAPAGDDELHRPSRGTAHHHHSRAAVHGPDRTRPRPCASRTRVDSPRTTGPAIAIASFVRPGETVSPFPNPVGPFSGPSRCPAMRTTTLRRVAALTLLPAASVAALSNAHRAPAQTAAPPHAAVPDFVNVPRFAAVGYRATSYLLGVSQRTGTCNPSETVDGNTVHLDLRLRRRDGPRAPGLRLRRDRRRTARRDRHSHRRARA